jgi:signal transduction histidine kinase/HAMP domain-containing protein
MGLSIRTKLLLTFFSVTFVIVAFELYLLFITKNALRQSVGQDSVFLAEDTIERIDKDIYIKIEEIQLYSQDTGLESVLKESNRAFDALENANAYIQAQDAEWTSAPEDEITPFMRELIAGSLSDTLRQEFIGFWDRKYGYPVYGEAFVSNKYGANIAQTGKTSDYWQADEEWWQEAKRKGFHVSGFEYDESAGAWSMPISVRIDDAKGKFLGVIKTVPLAREIVREAEPAAKKYNSTEILLLTADGKLIYSTKAFQVFEDVSSKEFFGNIKPGSGFFVAKGGGGKEKLFAYAQSRGHRNFEGLKWILLAGHDTAEVFSPIRQLQNTLAAVSVILFSVLGFTVFLLIRAISSPIRKLTEAANYIARGNLEVKIDINTKDEIGKLASTFNEMAGKLRRSYQNLEGKVRARTRELTQRIQELDKVARMLVRRDLELSEVRRKQEDQLADLDKAAKALVRRDLDLLKLNDELQEIDRAKSHFVSVAAHQLRTPLSIMKWTFRMLLSGDFGKLNDEQKDVIQRGYDVNEGTIILISDLLDVARIESGRFAYEFSDVSIDEIIKDAVEMNMPRAKERKIDVKIVKDSRGKVPFVKGDKTALRIALQNLLANAINYTLPGGKVEVIYRKKGAFAEVQVKDTGVGVPRNQMARLFTKFFRGDNVVRMQTSGTGLGLFIAKSIISAHNGQMGAESEEGKGSVFWFTIPSKS